MSRGGLDALAEGSEYALQQLHQEMSSQQQAMKRPGMQQRSNTSNSRQSFGGGAAAEEQLSGDENEILASPSDGPSAGKDHHSTANNGGGSKSGQQPVRRRISRACDQCNQLRTKCDGKFPCLHCVEFGLTCEYARERKKRGKASKKELAAAQQQQQAAAVAAGRAGGSQDDSPHSGRDGVSGEVDEETAAPASAHGLKRKRSGGSFATPQLPATRANGGSAIAGPQAQIENGVPRPSLDHANGTHMGVPLNGSSSGTHGLPMDQNPGMTLPTPQMSSQVGNMSLARSDYGNLDDYHRSMIHPGNAAGLAGHNNLHTGMSPMAGSILQGGTITGYENAYGVPSPGTQAGMGGPQGFRMGESPLAGGEFLGQSPPIGGSPGWLQLPSPNAGLYPGFTAPTSAQTLRYPVLQPLLPHISHIIPIGLACDLLELYFSSTLSTFMQPLSPYVLSYVFRKHSFLRQTNPRQCSPALLASMLWVSAQTSESAFLTSPPSARGRICQKLLEVTVSLLRPLIHTRSGSDNFGGAGGSHTVINGVALGGFGVAFPSPSQHDLHTDGSPGASGVLDDVATYIHLATVVSASEYKAASLRWWNSAWTLARELKLGRELEPSPGQGEHHGDLGDANGKQPSSGAGAGFSEEQREERRRIWWLLYIVDRHLALCYNRPLFLLDIECEGLMQPEDDSTWQAGEFYAGETAGGEARYFRSRGPPFECQGHGIYGFFLPLMTILGEIVDLNHARNHPRFGLRLKSGEEVDAYAREITQQLEAYERSLKAFEAQNLPQDQQNPQTSTDNDFGNNNNTNNASTNNNNTAANEAQQQDPSPSAQSAHSTHSNPRLTETQIQTKTILAYGTHLMHTLHILLNGKWDPISLLDDNDLWISTSSFVSATGHAVAAAEAINEILVHDPDLSFMPFFFGIYLLQGSFLLLLIADKLQADASPSVVRACESIVRAHEACVVTLSTEYQRNFRKVMRSALAQVRGRMAEDSGEQRLRRRETLSLYRWMGDGTGLAL